MSEPGFYRAVPFRSFPIDREHALLVTLDATCSTPVRTAVPVILGLALTARRLPELEGLVLARAPQADPSAVRATIGSLVNARLLVPVEVGTAAPPSPVLTVTTLGIVTVDRPAVLERALQSYVEHARRHGYRVRVVIIDGSRDRSRSADARQAAVRISRRGGFTLRYLDAEVRASLAAWLTQRGVPPSLLAFGLGDHGTGSIGALRNWLMIATGGEPTLLCDDATICQTWSWGRPVAPLALHGHRDPREYAFFDRRDTATSADLRPGGDLLAAHASLLGASFDALVRGYGPRLETVDACIDLLAMLDRGSRRARVRLTLSGIAGDIGVACPYRLLFRDGPIRKALAASRDLYSTALTFREAQMLAAGPAIVHDSACELYCTAIDGDDWLPPFVPVGSSEADAFGATLMACDPDALFGYVPLGVVHDTPQPSLYEDLEIASTARVTFGEVIACLVSDCPASMAGEGAGTRTRQVSARLRALGNLAPTEFADIIRSGLLARRSRELTWIDAFERDRTAAPHVAAGLSRYAAALLAQVEDPYFFVPDRRRWGTATADGIAALRTFVGQYGELLESWHEVQALGRDWIASAGGTAAAGTD